MRVPPDFSPGSVRGLQWILRTQLALLEFVQLVPTDTRQIIQGRKIESEVD